MQENSSDSRKKRRIAPLSFATTQPIESIAATASNHTLNTGPPAETGTWDFLAKWNTTDDAVICGIDEEEYYSDVSGGSSAATDNVEHESEDDNNASPEGLAARPSKLGTEKVVEVINDCIEVYAKAWTPGKGETRYKGETGQAEEPVTYDPLALWEEAEAAGQREQLAENYNMEAEYYRQRLDKLCEEILKDPGDTIPGVQMKCRNLEVTVELLERATWLGDIYRLPPDTTSDDEARSETSPPGERTRASGILSTASAQHEVPCSQVIDLGSPSDSQMSEDESILPVKSATDPSQAGIGNGSERSVSAERVTSDPAVIQSTETIGLVSTATSLLTVRSPSSLSDAPESASYSTVSRWSWPQLEETQDRKRIVSKAICELNATDRDVIRERLQKVGRASMVREIPACIDMLLRDDKRMPGILPQDLPKIINFTRLFLCWWLCGNYFQKEPSKLDLADLKDCLRDCSLDPSTFCDYVDTLLSTTLSAAALKYPTRPSQAEIVEISSDDEDIPSQTPHRKGTYTDKSERRSATIIID